jgi:hypothetical protein
MSLQLTRHQSLVISTIDGQGLSKEITQQKVTLMTDMHRFNKFLTLANQLASAATKEDLAECARLLAINIAHYESVHGALPLDETLEMAYAEAPNQAQIDLMARGMETMVGMLGGIVQGFESNPHH